MERKINIKLSDFYILKAYVQAQHLLETLDDVENESKMDIKFITKKYKNQLEKKIKGVIHNTFKSNPQLFDKIILEMNKYNNEFEKYFDIN